MSDYEYIQQLRDSIAIKDAAIREQNDRLEKQSALEVANTNVINDLNTKLTAQRLRINAIQEAVKAVILELHEDGHDEDSLERIADAAEIDMTVSVYRTVEIEATVEIEIGLFDKVEDYDFDYRITYKGDEVHVSDSDISVQE